MSIVKVDSVIGSFLPIPVIEHATDFEVYTATAGQTVFTTTKFDRSNSIRAIAKTSGGAFTEVTASWTGTNTVTTTGALLGAGQIFYIFKVGAHASKIRVQDATGAWVDLSSFTVAKAGANSDITSLTGLTTALSVGQGGTGKTSMGAAAVGTVSQLAGVPTGAIFERGSNAFGSWTKYADGQMECRFDIVGTTGVTTAYGSMFYAAIATRNTFPQAFVGEMPWIDIQAEGGALWTATTGLCSLTSWPEYYILSGISRAGATTTLRFIARGRWF